MGLDKTNRMELRLDEQAKPRTFHALALHYKEEMGKLTLARSSSSSIQHIRRTYIYFELVSLFITSAVINSSLLLFETKVGSLQKKINLHVVLVRNE